jgi:hypothetical protein
LRDTLSNDDCFAACRIRILLLTVTWLHVIQFILCKIWHCWMQQTTIVSDIVKKNANFELG